MANTTNPDGTTTRELEDPRFEPSPLYTDVEPWVTIGGLFAAQLALSRLLAGLVVHVRSLEKWLVEGDAGGVIRQIRLEHIDIDSPKVGEEIKPLSAAIIERAPQVIDDEIRTPRIVKERWNGHSLRCLACATCHLGVAAWFGHKDDRRAFRAAATRALLGEPKNDRGGRSIVVPEYFDRSVRLMLENVQNVDESAQGNHWTLQMAVLAYVEEIEVIGSPQPVRVAFRPDVGTAVEP